MSNVLSGLIVVVVAGLIGAIGLVAKLRLFPPAQDDEGGEDIAGYVTMMVGVLYALILGLSLVSVWENRDSAEGSVQVEASSLHETYVLAQALPPATNAQVHAAVQNYAHYVVEHEWPLMAARQPLGTTGWTLLDKVRGAYYSVNPANAQQQNVVSDGLTQLSTLADARRGRESDAEKHMPDLLWIGLVLGGVLTIALTFIYGMEKRFTHITMMMGLTALIGFLMILIYNLDNPFGQGIGTDPAPFERYFPTT